MTSIQQEIASIQQSTPQAAAVAPTPNLKSEVSEMLISGILSYLTLSPHEIIRKILASLDLSNLESDVLSIQPFPRVRAATSANNSSQTEGPSVQSDEPLTTSQASAAPAKQNNNNNNNNNFL